MSHRIRPLELEDLEQLRPLDAEYAAAHAAPALASPAGLRFFARTGHAFVAERGGAVCGFVLAQALWDGVHPTLWLMRLVAAEADARASLAEALVKSSYDAAVYHLRADLPPTDAPLQEALRVSGWQSQPLVHFVRTLGSGAGVTVGA
jgi:hypothetical protein